MYNSTNEKTTRKRRKRRNPEIDDSKEINLTCHEKFEFPGDDKAMDIIHNNTQPSCHTNSFTFNLNIIRTDSSNSNMNLDNTFDHSQTIKSSLFQRDQLSIFTDSISDYCISYTDEQLNEKYNTESFEAEDENMLAQVRNKDYILFQTNIADFMRTILLDWVMEVCSQFNFKRATFHSSVVLFDVHMSLAGKIDTGLLQLIGVTCLIIAAKNEVIL